MHAMLEKFRTTLIFDERSALKCAIWLCMYCRNVRDVQRPCFIMVVSLSPVSLSAIAPPARREWTPTKTGLIPDRWSLRLRTAIRMVVRKLVAVTCVHLLLWKTSHISFEVFPPLDKMWCTLRAQALTGQVRRWCRAW